MLVPSARQFILIGILLCLVLPLEASGQGVKGIWDDKGTHAKSGVEGDLLDPKDTTGQSGVNPRPQTFFIPPERKYTEVDPTLSEDNQKKDYSPYPILMLPHAIQYQGKTIAGGRYQVKLAAPTAGSPTVHLTKTQIESLDPVTRRPVLQHTLEIFRLGKVLAILPVTTIESFDPPKADKKKYRKPIVEFSSNTQRDTLRYYQKHQVFIAPLD